MLPRRIGLASRSQTVGLHELAKVAAALNLQAARDLEPIWSISATVAALPDPESIDPGVWPIFVVDDVGANGALGLHYTDHNQPYALVQAGPTWSLTASHECLEMLVDPSGSWLVSSSAITIANNDVQDLSGEKFEYLVEVADPSEDQANAYMIDDILVSDFYTPRFYDPMYSPGVRYSFSGKVVRPRQVLPGGYISWMNSRLGVMQQLKWFGQPEIVDLPGSPAASGHKSLRSFVDSQTRPPYLLSSLDPGTAAAKRQQERTLWLQSTSALRSATYAFARQPSGQPTALPSREPVQQVLDAHSAELKVPGVTRLYVGWHFENNWITYQRAIVVLVDKAAMQGVIAQLPAEIAGVPIDVRRDPRKKKTAATGALPTAMVAFDTGAVREESTVPNFPGQISMINDVEPSVLAAHSSKPVVNYDPPKGVTLDPITANMTLTLHASPEQGWAQLKPFLNDVKKELVVGMYEFTAPHIENALLKGLSSKDKLTLVLDSPPDQHREQTVEQTEQHLRQSLAKRLNFAWALSGMGHEAPAKTFETSYHIKVAVKDGEAMWLSSGNWNSTNQPNLDPSDIAAAKQAATTNDRDWHVIAESPELSKVFRAFLLKDYETAASAVPSATAAAGPIAQPPSDEQPDPSALAARTPLTIFPPLVIKRSIKIKPLLTPDDYRKPILELIQSAKSRFFMQTQYIHPTADGATDDGAVKHEDLIEAVAKLINGGVDVRLITSEYQDHMWIEKLQDAGVNAVEYLRIQPHVHNKGIVVDSEVVVVSSQNWSEDGTGPNRDAGLIIYDPEAARYFESIFLHDWINMATAKALM